MVSKIVNNGTISKREYFFVGLFLIGLYTGIEYELTQTMYVPFFLSGLAAPYFFVKNFDSIKRPHIAALAFIYLVTFYGILFAPNGIEQLPDRLLGLLYLIYSSATAYLFFLHLRGWNSKRISKLFLIFVVLILIGSSLEVFTSFKSISDQVRYMVFDPSVVYDNDLRDIYLHGMIRPKLFTSEPSHVGKFFAIALFIWFSLSESRRRYVLFVVFLAAGLYIIRSPSIIIAVPLAVAGEVFLKRRFNLKTNMLVLFTFLTGILLANTVFAERVDQIISGREGSFYLRVVAPAELAFKTIQKYPLWGAGVSGKEAISGLMTESYAPYLSSARRKENLPGNFFWILITLYGLLGSLLFIIGFIALVKSLGIKHVFFVVTAVLALSQMMGALIGLRTWSYIFLILLVDLQWEYLQSEYGTEKPIS